MKKINLPLVYLFIAAFASLLLNSCNSNNDEPVTPANQYVISSQVVDTITTQQAIDHFTKLAPTPDIVTGLSFLINSDVEVRKLIYQTTFKNQKIQASGLVCFPQAPGDYPVLSFQNGTNTLHSLAPSEDYGDDLYSIIESVASMGFVVVIPDYIGFGSSAQFPHPYLDATSTTQSILDMLRATEELGSDVKIVAKPTKDLFIFGYSQGGWATMELQKSIESDYSTEFNLIASSCGAGPYSIQFLNSLILSQSDYPYPYFLAYVLNAYHAIGEISNPLTDIFNEPFASKIPDLFDGNHTGGAINAELTTNLDSLFTPEYKNQYETNTKFAGLRSAFIANSIAAWNISTPTRLYHGQNDEVIPYSMSETMLADFKAKGVPDTKISLIPIPGADHTSGVYPTGLQTILWFLSMKN